MKSMFLIFVFASTKSFITLSAKLPDMTAIDSSGKNHTGIHALLPGQSLVIYCSHTNEIKWSKLNFDTSKNENLASKNNIRIDVNNLTITNVSLKDSGVYYCEKNAVAYPFILHVFTINQSTNGTVQMINKTNTFNTISFSQLILNERESVNVSCSCNNASNNTKLNIAWRGGLYEKVSKLYNIIPIDLETGIQSTLVLIKTTNDKKMYGEYICSCNVLTGSKIEQKVYMKVPPIFDNHRPSLSTSEGEDVTLHCKVWGYPEVDNNSIKWSFQNKSVMRENILVSRNLSNPGSSTLFIPKVTNADRGVYSCHATNDVGSNYASTVVRVKSRYAALWPFIGIVIELIILITIIVVYEWRKSHNPKEDTPKSNAESRNEPGVSYSERSPEPDSVRQRLVKV